MKQISALCALFAASMLLASCSGRQPANSGPARVKVPEMTEQGGDVALEDRTVEVPKGEDAARAALKSLFDYAGGRTNAIPKGTRLLELKVEGGTARLNLSKEFNELAGAGNEGESMAQKALRRTLAQFKDIERMVVLVEGKPFASEHADWSEPIPVREEEDVAHRDRRPEIGLTPGGGE